MIWRKIKRRKRNIVLAGLIVVFLIAGLVSAALSPEDPQTLIVKRDTVLEEVSVSGKIDPSEQVDLSFERSGQVESLKARVGDKVRPGMLLARLKSGDLSGQVTQARANLLAEEARLAELKAGPRPEDLRLSESQVEAARQSLTAAQASFRNAIADAYSKTDDALKGNADYLFESPEFSPRFRLVLNSTSGSIIFGGANIGEEAELNNKRQELNAALRRWSASLNGSSTPEAALEAERTLRLARSFADLLGAIVSQLSTSDLIYKTTVDGYKAKASTARAQINAAWSSLLAAEQAAQNAEATLATAKRQLELKLAGASPQAITIQAAAVMRARGALEAASSQYGQALIISPISGTLTRLDLNPGEFVSASKIVASVAGSGRYEVEAFVSEVDVGRIQLADEAVVTVDAFTGEQFSGHVSYVEPAETVTDGVVTYKIRVVIDENNPKFKSGLTASLAIKTEVKSDVVTISQLALLETKDGLFVKKIINGEPVETPIKIGIRGTNGLIEVTEGLVPGDKVVNVGLKRND